MNWIETVDRAIRYMEAHITEPLTAAQIADAVYVSPYYFQKGFTMLCGLTAAE